jgi:hypothetical protein
MVDAYLKRDCEVVAACSAAEDIFPCDLGRYRPQNGSCLIYDEAARAWVVRPDARLKVARALAGEARRLNRGLKFQLAKLYLLKFVLSVRRANLEALSLLHRCLLKFITYRHRLTNYIK